LIINSRALPITPKRSGLFVMNLLSISKVVSARELLYFSQFNQGISISKLKNGVQILLSNNLESK